MRKVLFAVMILAAIGGGIAWSQGLFTRRESNQALTLYGNVDIRQVNLSFRVSGRVAAMKYEEGDSLKASDVVAVLDKVPFEEAVRVAKAQAAQAAATLSKFEAGNRPQEIAMAEAAVAAREAELAFEMRESDRAKTLLSTKGISQTDFEQIVSKLAQARANLASARESLSLAKAGFRPEDVAASRAALEAAEGGLAEAQTRLSDTALTAPSDGTILTRVVEPGAVVSAGQTVYTLALIRPVWVRAYVDEIDLGLIYPGMPATVYTDSAPDHPYQGHIGFISPTAEFTPKSVETPGLRTALVYRLRVIVDDPDQGLRQGMPVTVSLETKNHVGKGMPQ